MIWPEKSKPVPNRYTCFRDSHQYPEPMDMALHQMELWRMDQPLAQFPDGRWWEDIFAGDGHPPLSNEFGRGGMVGRVLKLKKCKVIKGTHDIALSNHWARIQLGDLFTVPATKPMFQPLTTRINWTVMRDDFTEDVVQALYGFKCDVKVWAVPEEERLEVRQPRRTPNPFSIMDKWTPPLPPATSPYHVPKDKVRVVKGINGITVLFLATLAVEDYYSDATMKLWSMPDVGRVIFDDVCTHALGGYLGPKILGTMHYLQCHRALQISTSLEVDLPEHRLHQLYCLGYQAGDEQAPYSTFKDPEKQMINYLLVLYFTPKPQDLDDQEGYPLQPPTTYDSRVIKLKGHQYGGLVGAILTHILTKVEEQLSTTERRKQTVNMVSLFMEDLTSVIPAAFGVPVSVKGLIDAFKVYVNSLLDKRHERKVAKYQAMYKRVKDIIRVNFEHMVYLFGAYMKDHVGLFISHALAAIVYALQLNLEESLSAAGMQIDFNSITHANAPEPVYQQTEKALTRTVHASHRAFIALFARNDDGPILLKFPDWLLDGDVAGLYLDDDEMFVRFGVCIYIPRLNGSTGSSGSTGSTAPAPGSHPAATWLALAIRTVRANPRGADLSFNEGDVVRVLEHHDAEWVRAVCKGREGDAPLDALKKWQVTALCNHGSAVVKGDVLDIIAREDDMLVFITQDGRQGIVDKAKVANL